MASLTFSQPNYLDRDLFIKARRLRNEINLNFGALTSLDLYFTSHKISLYLGGQCVNIVDWSRLLENLTTMMCTETDASADGANFRWKQHVLALHNENYCIYKERKGWENTSESSYLGFPLSAAWWRALNPLLLVNVISALWSRSKVSISSRFFEMASCRGVSPSKS